MVATVYDSGNNADDNGSSEDEHALPLVATAIGWSCLDHNPITHIPEISSLLQFALSERVCASVCVLACVCERVCARQRVPPLSSPLYD